MNVLHNSALAEFRDPLGAARTGEEVLLRIQAEDACSVLLRLYQNDVGSEIKMEPVDGYWQCRFTVPEEPCILWYSFFLETEKEALYYGPPMGGRNQGEGLLYPEPCPSFQLTVYARSYQTPEWFRGKIMYQIFPDRFRRGDPANLVRGADYHGRMGRTVILHENW